MRYPAHLITECSGLLIMVGRRRLARGRPRERSRIRRRRQARRIIIGSGLRKTARATTRVITVLTTRAAVRLRWPADLPIHTRIYHAFLPFQSLRAGAVSGLRRAQITTSRL